MEGAERLSATKLSPNMSNSSDPLMSATPAKSIRGRVDGPGFLKQHHGRAHQENADRYIDIEDVAPGVLAHDPAPQVRPDNRPHAENTGKQADCSFAILWEVIAHDPGGRGKKTGAPDTLKEPECYQGMDSGRKAASEGTAGEEQEGKEKDLFAPEAVAQVSRQRHCHRDGNKVDRDRPRRPEDVRMELPGEVREGDGDHRGVDGIHEDAKAGGKENKVTAHSGNPLRERCRESTKLSR